MNRGAQETKAGIKRKGWTHDNGDVNLAQAGRELGCDPSNLAKILRGERGPGRLVAENARVKLGVAVEHWPSRKPRNRSPKGRAA